MARVPIQRVLTKPVGEGSYTVVVIDNMTTLGVYTDSGRMRVAKVYPDEISTVPGPNPISPPDANGVINGWLDAPARYYTRAGPVDGTPDAVSSGNEIPVFNVRWYGAKGDGGDDTQAVKTAFTAAANAVTTDSHYGRQHIH